MKKKQQKKQSLADRVKALRAECEAALDKEAEKQRPKGEGCALPAESMRAMWMARGGGHIFDAYLIATGQL
jgi:hypothetical protein